jgi:hypothetical protein
MPDDGSDGGVRHAAIVAKASRSMETTALERANYNRQVGLITFVQSRSFLSIIPCLCHQTLTSFFTPSVFTLPYFALPGGGGFISH